MTDPGGPSSPESGEAKVLFGKYEVGRLLGCGGSAKVYHARNILTGQSVAIKCIGKLRISKGGAAPAVIKREVTIMRRLRQHHIIRLLEVLASRTKIYFVLELAKGGELFDRLAARGRLPEDQSRRYFQQLISAVGYCHSRGVFHRDLKPENLLLDDAGDLKISDFGLSAVAADQITGDGLLHTICGTPAYVAPEILAKKGYDGATVDVWSCGVILFVLSAGYLPFNDRNLMAMYRKIYRGEYRAPRWISPELRRLIARLLDTNPETRITVDEILHDRWFKKGLDEEKFAAMMRFHDDGDDDKISKETAAAAEEEEEEEEQRELNAFDIISFSSGFSLSGLFEVSEDRERFVSAGSAEVILERVEEVGREEGLVIRRRGKKRISGIVVEGRSGNVVSRVKIYRLTGRLVVVEAKMGLLPLYSQNYCCPPINTALRPGRTSTRFARISAKAEKAGDDEEGEESKQSLFGSVMDALDFSQVRSSKDAELLDEAKEATKSGGKMNREQYGALRRKIGGTYKDFFKSYVDVDGQYVEEGWVDKTCKICKRDTRGEPRQVDNLGRYVHTACLENSKSNNFFSKLFSG